MDVMDKGLRGVGAIRPEQWSRTNNGLTVQLSPLARNRFDAEHESRRQSLRPAQWFARDPTVYFMRVLDISIVITGSEDSDELRFSQAELSWVQSA